MAELDATNRGTSAAAIATSVTRLHKEHTGRGPTSARTVIDGDLVTVLLRGALTTAERSLLEHGRLEVVEELRRACHAAMRDDLVAAVQMLTQRTVIGFLSAHDAEPNITAFSFVLLPDPANGSAPTGSPVQTTHGAETAASG